MYKDPFHRKSWEISANQNCMNQDKSHGYYTKPPSMLEIIISIQGCPSWTHQSQVAQLPALFRRGVVPDNIIPKDGPFPVPREGENLQELCTEGGGGYFSRSNPGGLAQV